jgi:Zn-dependent metalloprotease
MTSKDGSKFVFTPQEISALFYLGLTQHLSRTSNFSDSRRAVLLAARTLFRSLQSAMQRKKIRAIEQGFAAAGITE